MALKRGFILGAAPVFAIVALAALFVFQGSALAETGVTGSEVTLGMANALTGPASALGTGIKKGASVYFEKINAGGGINGRKIKLISYDDGYEPKDTVTATNRLIKEDKVFALFGYVGTPTSKAIMPTINNEKIIFFGPFTGAEFLRSPVNKYIFNVRGSYFDEAETQVRHLAENLGIKKIGLFIQDDAYGLAVKGGVVRSLRQRGLELSGEGRYTRNTVDIEEGLSALKKANPEAVSMVGTYSAMAAFIKKAKKEGFDPVFLNVSFVGTDELVKELGPSGEGVVITQVMPSPYNPSLPIVKQYQEDMKAAGHSEFDYVSLEGYVDALVFAEILKKAGKDLTRDSFIAAAEALNLKHGGLAFSMSPKNHQALEKIHLTKITGGRAAEMK